MSRNFSVCHLLFVNGSNFWPIDIFSQELLEAVVHERNVRTNQTRNTTIFHHPALGDFELQHVCGLTNMIYFSPNEAENDLL
jgi:hypothetical protein